MRIYFTALTMAWPRGCGMEVRRGGRWAPHAGGTLRAGDEVRFPVPGHADYALGRGWIGASPPPVDHDDYPAAPPAPADGEAPAPAAPAPGDPPWMAEVLEGIASMLKSDPDRAKPNHWLRDGRPQTGALSAHAGFRVSAGRRDRAWARHRGRDG